MVCLVFIKDRMVVKNREKSFINLFLKRYNGDRFQQIEYQIKVVDEVIMVVIVEDRFLKVRFDILVLIFGVLQVMVFMFIIEMFELGELDEKVIVVFCGFVFMSCQFG